MESKANAMHDVLQWLCSCNPRAGNNFYGRLLTGCSRMPVKDFKTCAVALTPEGHYRFLWDPEWYETQPRPFQVLVVIHEVAHLVLRHLERILRIRVKVGDQAHYDKLRDIINIAADMAANDTVVQQYATANSKLYEEEMPKFVLPKHRGYPSGETFDEYLARLLEDMEKSGWSPGAAYPEWFSDLVGRSAAPMMDPIINVPMSDLTDAEFERIISTAGAEARQMIRKAVERTKKSRGTVPSHLLSLLEEFMEEPKVPWPQIFRGYMKTACSSRIAESSAYPNPALVPLCVNGDFEPYTGYQKEFTFNMAVLIDSSGSIGHEEYETFITEIRSIARAEPGAQAVLVYFDSAVQKVEQLSLGPETLQHPYRYAQGGTDFRPPFRYIQGLDTRVDPSAHNSNVRPRRWDLVIMLTDGEAPIESPGGPCPDLIPPCPVIWVLTGRRQAHPAMGSRVVSIE